MNPLTRSGFRSKHSHACVRSQLTAIPVIIYSMRRALDRLRRPCFTVPERIEAVSYVPTTLNGWEVYRIGEALERAGLSRSTFFRWIREGRIKDTQFHDRNGRRVFTARELDELCAKAQRLVSAPGKRLKD